MPARGGPRWPRLSGDHCLFLSMEGRPPRTARTGDPTQKGNGNDMPLTKKIQEIVDRNSHIREKMLGTISDLNETQLNYKSAGADWSICDIVHHLALTAEANTKLMSNLLKRAREENLPPDPSPEGSEIHAADEVFDRV